MLLAGALVSIFWVDEPKNQIAPARVGPAESIWARTFAVQGQPTKFYSLTLERSYKDRDGAWKYTKSLDADSLGQIIALCQQASEVIGELQHDDALAVERKEER
jgi:hypothetical protein